MSDKIQEYTITVFTENQTGLMARIVNNITRRHINIESISASPSSMKDIHRFTIVVGLTEERVRKLVAQIDKQVDVLKAFYYTNEEIVYQEVALYKVPIALFTDNNAEMQALVREHNARILTIEQAYVVIEKTGHPDELTKLFEALKKRGIYEFARSGRVAIVKPMERLNAYLKEIETLISQSNQN